MSSHPEISSHALFTPPEHQDASDTAKEEAKKKFEEEKRDQRADVLVSEFETKKASAKTVEDYQELEKILEQIEALYTEHVDLHEAERIMGKDFLGPEALKKAFDTSLGSIPEIPYSAAQLENAKKHGEMLVLRADKDKDGIPLTLEHLQTCFVIQKGQKLTATDWNASSQPFAGEVSQKLEWKLVTKDVLPGSRGKTYFEQTMILFDHLVTTGTIIDDAQGSRKKKVQQEIDDIKADAGADWKKAAEMLAAHPINATYRRKAVETAADTGAYFAATGGERLLSGVYDWGNSRNADGYLVFVGFFGADGAYLFGNGPGYPSGFLGVCSSR